MIPWRQIARMSNLAARFVGGANVHVVDPQVDLSHIFGRSEEMQRSIEERRLQVELPKIAAGYEEWFAAFKAWKAADEADSSLKGEATELKKAMRSQKDGLLNALALPNFVHNLGKEERKMQKPTKHVQYLAQQGLMRVDKNNHVVHLAGFPVLVETSLRTQLIDLFPASTLMSPSYFARAAILDALNVNRNDFVQFTDSSSSFPHTYLVGNSLAALCSPFLKTVFSEKNEWPISVQSIGAGYHEKKNSVDLVYARQRTKHCVLHLAKTETDLDGFIANSIATIAGLFHEGLFLEVNARVVKGKELRNYESQAVVVECHGLELARASRIGEYISRRLNVCGKTGDQDEFVQMAYVETDVSRVLARLVDDLVDGKQPSKTVRDCVKLAQ